MASEELFSYICIAVADVALATLTGLIQHAIKLTFADRRWMCLNGGWEMSLAFLWVGSSTKVLNKWIFFLPVGNAESKEY